MNKLFTREELEVKNRIVDIMFNNLDISNIFIDKTDIPIMIRACNMIINSVNNNIQELINIRSKVEHYLNDLNQRG